MIKKTITYTNFNDVQVTKDFYFHLSKVDALEIALDGLFEKELKEAIAKDDRLKVFQMFKELIRRSVGTRSENGEEFVRPEMFREAFMSSPAFDELIMDLFQSPDQGASFVAGLLPKDMQEKAAKEIEAQQKVDPFDETPAWEKENRDPTQAELISMTREQLQKVMAKKLGSVD